MTSRFASRRPAHLAQPACLLALSLAFTFTGVAAAGARTAPGQHAIPARPGGALTLCPNPDGIGAFDPAARSESRADALRYRHASEAVDLRDSDPAWQPTVRKLWSPPRTGSQKSSLTVWSVTAARKDGYSSIVRSSCGASLVDRSLTVTIAPLAEPGEHPCDACAETFFFVDRHRRALIYFIY